MLASRATGICRLIAALGSVVIGRNDTVARPDEDAAPKFFASVAKSRAISRVNNAVIVQFSEAGSYIFGAIGAL